MGYGRGERVGRESLRKKRNWETCYAIDVLIKFIYNKYSMGLSLTFYPTLRKPLERSYITLESFHRYVYACAYFVCEEKGLKATTKGQSNWDYGSKMKQ